MGTGYTALRRCRYWSASILSNLFSPVRIFERATNESSSVGCGILDQGLSFVLLVSRKLHSLLTERRFRAIVSVAAKKSSRINQRMSLGCLPACHLNAVGIEKRGGIFPENQILRLE